jgi:hypothetical protein
MGLTAAAWRPAMNPVFIPSDSNHGKQHRPAEAAMRDALSRIEAAATFLVEAKAARALSADDMHEAVRRIRDIARAALGMD